MAGPFYHNDTDVYEEDGTLHWLLWILLVFYGFIVVFYLAVPINNSSRKYTYFESITPPGTLSSDRYDIYWFAYVFSIVAAIGIPFSLLVMIIYRKTYGCNVGWTVTMIVLALLQLIALFIMFGAIIQCNHDGNPENPCNSHLACCVPEYLSIAANGCTNFAPCPAGPYTRSELGWNNDFLWVFWTNMWFVAVNGILLVTIALYWVQTPTKQDAVVQDVIDEESLVESNIKPVSKGAMIKRSHGLVKRNK